MVNGGLVLVSASSPVTSVPSDINAWHLNGAEVPSLVTQIGSQIQLSFESPTQGDVLTWTNSAGPIVTSGGNITSPQTLTCVGS